MKIQKTAIPMEKVLWDRSLNCENEISVAQFILSDQTSEFLPPPDRPG
jgi:hypothetical protein